MRLSELVDASNDVANVSSRLAKIERLAALLDKLSPDEIETVIAFLSGKPGQGRIGMAWTGVAVATEAVQGSPVLASTLEVQDVDRTFDEISRATGPGSAGARTTLLHDLFVRATEREREFLIRILSGELRQGALEGILLEAVARAARMPAPIIRQAAMTAGDLRTVARVALTEGAVGLSQFVVQIFRPIQPMLAGTAVTVEDALQELGRATLEYKLDGARVQAHKRGDDVKVFSRNLRVTAAVPEVVDAMRATR